MSLKSKIKGMLHAILMMAKEEKVQPIIVPTDKENCWMEKLHSLPAAAVESDWQSQRHFKIAAQK